MFPALLLLLPLPGCLGLHHLHHGVERANSWDDVWLVQLQSDIEPNVRTMTSIREHNVFMMSNEGQKKY